jgi:hypothetical protein
VPSKDACAIILPISGRLDAVSEGKKAEAVPILGLVVGVLVGVFVLHSFLWGVALGFVGGVIGWGLRLAYVVLLSAAAGRENR